MCVGRTRLRAVVRQWVGCEASRLQPPGAPSGALVGVEVPPVPVEVRDTSGSAAVGRVGGWLDDGGARGNGSLEEAVNGAVVFDDEVADTWPVRRVVVAGAGGAEHHSTVVAPVQLGVRDQGVVVRIAYDDGSREPEGFEELDGLIGVRVAQAVE